MEIKFNVRSLIRKRLLLIIMRTFIFLLCTTVFSFSPVNSFSQEKINIDANKEVSVHQVFRIIKNQTKYRFLYPEDLFKDAPKVKLKKGVIEISKLLEQSFKGINIKYKLSENNIIEIEENKTPTKLNKEKQQQIQVSGTVVDQNDQPLPGANILAKGTTNGTQTDFDGKFSLDIADENTTLIISYLGFVTQEIVLNNQTDLTVVLIEDAAALDEVVVIGYGTLSRSKVTGAVSSIGSDDIGELPVNGIDESIAGRVAGVQIVSSGTPGGGSAINIRGIGTLTAGGSPLIVVDGYPLTEGSDLNAINPNDIQTMDILKDAASTAIYGSRGANGVILVTTKRAKSDKVSFDFNTYSGFQDVLNEPKLMDAYQFAEVIKEARDWGYISADPINRSENDDNTTRLSQGAVSRHLIPTNFDKYLDGTPGLTNNDWLDDLFRSGRIESYDIAVSGKSGSTNWYISGGYFNQEGLIIGSDFERYIAKINLETKFTDKIKFGINLSPSVSNQNSVIEGWTDGPMQQAILSEPFFTPYNDEGNLNISQQIRWHNNGGTDGALAENPIAIALQKKDEKSKFRLFGSTFLEIEFFEGLKFKTLLGGDFDYSLREEFRPSTIGRYRNDVSSVVPWAKEKTKSRKNIISENTLNYTKAINKHSINLLGGYSYQKETRKDIFVNAPTLDSNNIENVAGTSETTSSKDIFEWVRISYSSIILNFLIVSNISSIF